MNETQIELKIYEYMKDLKEVSLSLRDAIKKPTEQMESLEKEIDKISEPFSNESERLQEMIISFTMELGKSVKTGSGNVTYRKGSTRRTWDSNKLDEWLDSHFDIKNQIWGFRKETRIDPSVTIKVDVEGVSNASV